MEEEVGAGGGGAVEEVGEHVPEPEELKAGATNGTDPPWRSAGLGEDEGVLQGHGSPQGGQSAAGWDGPGHPEGGGAWPQGAAV